MSRRLLPLLAIPFVLAGCDQLGLEAASVTAARVEADGRAVGAGCRHGGRAIEDCFTLNKRVDKAAIYAGWREMDDYMRENKLEAVAPTLGAPVKRADADDGAADASTAKADGDKAAADKPAEKSARAAGPKGDKADKVAKADKAGDDKPAEH